MARVINWWEEYQDTVNAAVQCMSFAALTMFSVLTKPYLMFMEARHPVITRLARGLAALSGAGACVGAGAKLYDLYHMIE